jgi:hypothetical protein
MKIEVSDFWEVLCSRGHEDWRKLKYLIFGKFHLPGVMKIEVSDFWEVLCTWGHENWRKMKRLILGSFAYPGS